MSGTATRRFCTHCRKHVHDLSALTELQAHRLLRTEGKLCVQYRTDAAGHILFQPAGPSLRAPRAQGRRGVAAAAAAAAMFAACEPGTSDGVYDDGVAGYALLGAPGDARRDDEGDDEDAGTELPPGVGEWLDGHGLAAGGASAGGAVALPPVGVGVPPASPSEDTDTDTDTDADADADADADTDADADAAPAFKLMGKIAPRPEVIFRGSVAPAVRSDALLMGEVSAVR